MSPGGACHDAQVTVPLRAGPRPGPHLAAAVDIGATMHVAAVSPRCDPEPVRTFGSVTGDLHCLADWFEQCGVATVGLVSTGVDWIPLYEILTERGFAVVVVNVREVKQVPGRKTDVCDAQWLERLHEYVLLQASFHPQGERLRLGVSAQFDPTETGTNRRAKAIQLIGPMMNWPTTMVWSHGGQPLAVEE